MTNKTKKNILVLRCGGTIVMTENKDGLLETPSEEEAKETLLNLEPRIGEICNLSDEPVTNIDSTDMNPAEWDNLIKKIRENYDKI